MSGTSKDEIRGWLLEAKEEGATHVVIVCDTFDHENFPVSVMPGQDPSEIAEKNSNESKMLRVMEVYSLRLDIEDQLNEDRAFHYD